MSEHTITDGVIELMRADGVTLHTPVETAIRCGYKRQLNEMGTASLELAQGDALCEAIDVPTSWLRLWDGDRFAGLYRFKSAEYELQESGGTARYELESAECTLLDDMLIGHHELGGTELNTRWVMEYILGHQTERRWVLGRCDFADQYMYNFEDVTLLEALMSLGEVLVDDYAFIFDAQSVPWTVSLVKLDAEPTRSLVYGRNVSRIVRTVDGRVVTRLVGRGYGEGDNQLTVESVNDGLDYIDADDATMAHYGVRVGMHADRRQTDPNTLLARMRAILAVGCRPQVTYQATCADLYAMTGESWDDVQDGDMVLVLDETLGETVRVRVTAREKEDVTGDPGSMMITLDSRARDVAEELNEILDKIGVQELYSQGATNMYSMQISDNADAGHPLTMRFYVPGNVLRINSCRVCWKLERFRTYVTMLEAEKEVSRTSKAGGGATVSIPTQVVTTAASTGAPMAGEGTSAVYTEANESGLSTSTKAAFNTGTPIGAASGSSMTETGTGGPQNTGYDSPETDSAGSHSHTVNSHLHNLNAHTHSSFTSGPSPATTVAVAPGTSSNGSHRHTVDSHRHSVEQHSHGMNHYHSVAAHSHTIDSHTHKFDHWHRVTVTVTIPSLTFELTAHSHTYVIPEHTHELVYGVYEGARASALGIVVDGEEVPAEAIGEDDELDVAPYLRKNADGKVVRGTWHEIEFVPDGLTRLTADLFFQVFIQSRGAGDY